MYKNRIQNSEARRQNGNTEISTVRCPLEKSGIGVNLRLSAVHKVEKTKPINQPSAGNPKSEYRNPNEWNRCCLKKQSQFADGQIGVRSYMKGCYEEYRNLRRRKNKANQTQFAGLQPEFLNSKF